MFSNSFLKYKTNATYCEASFVKFRVVKVSQFQWLDIYNGLCEPRLTYLYSQTFNQIVIFLIHKRLFKPSSNEALTIRYKLLYQIFLLPSIRTSRC